MATYTVTARRTGDWWALEVPDVPGAYSQCKRLDQADEMAREAIALVLDIDEALVEVHVEPVLEANVSGAIDEVREARAAQEEAARRAMELQAEVVRTLVKHTQLSYRDAGAIVGISHQRVSQILTESSSKGRSSASSRRAGAKLNAASTRAVKNSVSRAGGRARKGSKIS